MIWGTVPDMSVARHQSTRPIIPSPRLHQAPRLYPNPFIAISNAMLQNLQIYPSRKPATLRRRRVLIPRSVQRGLKMTVQNRSSMNRKTYWLTRVKNTCVENVLNVSIDQAVFAFMRILTLERLVSSLIVTNEHNWLHTFAAFRCPYPGCGRMFNVNSNMRRHYRNHVTAGSSSLHGPEIDPSILPRQRKRRNIKQTEPAPGTSDVPFPSFGGATAAPVLKKAQWSCNETRSQNSSDSDDSTDDNMDIDTDRSHPIPVPPDQRSWRSGPQCHFNYPVYVPRKDRANRANPDPMHTSPFRSCEPSSPLRDNYTNHERRSSPSHSPHSSLCAIANLIR